jgi:hypothetical protein
MSNVIKPVQNALKKPAPIQPSRTGVPSNTGILQDVSKQRAVAAANIAKMQATLAAKLPIPPKISTNTSNQKKTVNTNKIPSGMNPIPTIDREKVFGPPPTSVFTYSEPEFTSPDVIVRIPERDVVNYQDEDIPAELIISLLFENLGANELIKFERHDTIEGTNANYDIISNLSSIRQKFNPASLISRQKPDTSYFDIFNIKLEDKIPTDLYLRNNPKVDATGEVNTTDYVYIDQEGNLVIELVNIDSDEILEVEIDSNGTIYKVQL